MLAMIIKSHLCEIECLKFTPNNIFSHLSNKNIFKGLPATELFAAYGQRRFFSHGTNSFIYN